MSCWNSESLLTSGAVLKLCNEVLQIARVPGGSGRTGEHLTVTMKPSRRILKTSPCAVEDYYIVLCSSALEHAR